MNDAQLAVLLNTSSPWRAVERWEQDDADLRAAARVQLSYEPSPLEDIRPPGMYVFRGPRRVGKSLELKRAISRLIRSGVPRETILYCSCDGLSKQDLRRLIHQGHNITRTIPGPRYWFLDEVTAVRGWSEIVKVQRDGHTGFRESCVVVTGSSARDLETARSDLADRRGNIADSDRLLLPMGFRDFCLALGDYAEMPDMKIRPRDFLEPSTEAAIWQLQPWSSRLDDAWQLYLTIGGFPRAVGEFVATSAVSDGFMQGLWDVVVGDAIRSTRTSETEVAALLSRLVENLCSPVNLSRVATNVGLSGHQALQNRIRDLTEAFLAWHCYRIREGRPNVAAQSKLYFVDPLITRLPHFHNPALPLPDHSQLNEQQLGLALARAAVLKGPATFVQSDRVMHERTESSEIDFVGAELDVPFECKYTDDNWRQETIGMRVRYGRGVILTRSPLAVGDEEAVWAVPAGIAAWLLG